MFASFVFGDLATSNRCHTISRRRFDSAGTPIEETGFKPGGGRARNSKPITPINDAGSGWSQAVVEGDPMEGSYPWSKPGLRHFQDLAERVVAFGNPGCDNDEVPVERH